MNLAKFTKTNLPKFTKLGKRFYENSQIQIYQNNSTQIYKYDFTQIDKFTRTNITQIYQCHEFIQIYEGEFTQSQIVLNTRRKYTLKTKNENILEATGKPMNR